MKCNAYGLLYKKYFRAGNWLLFFTYLSSEPEVKDKFGFLWVSFHLYSFISERKTEPSWSSKKNKLFTFRLIEGSRLLASQKYCIFKTSLAFYIILCISQLSFIFHFLGGSELECESQTTFAFAGWNFTSWHLIYLSYHSLTLLRNALFDCFFMGWDFSWLHRIFVGFASRAVGVGVGGS